MVDIKIWNCFLNTKRYLIRGVSVADEAEEKCIVDNVEPCAAGKGSLKCITVRSRLLRYCYNREDSLPSREHTHVSPSLFFFYTKISGLWIMPMQV